MFYGPRKSNKVVTVADKLLYRLRHALITIKPVETGKGQGARAVWWGKRRAGIPVDSALNALREEVNLYWPPMGETQGTSDPIILRGPLEPDTKPV